MRKRNQRVEVYLTKEELTRLNENVARTGMSREGYMRALILGHEPKELPPMDFYDLLKELRQINNNINQIAAKANSIGFVDHGQYRKDSMALSEVIGKLVHEVFG